MRYPHLFQPLKIGPVTLENRLMMGSMHTGMEGLPDAFDRLAAFYRARAEGGAGLIVTGGFSPTEDGEFGDGDSLFNAAEHAETHAVIPAAVHAAGGRIFLQFLHAGRYSKRPDAVAPSAIRAPINRNQPRALAADEIPAIIEAYGRSAVLAQQAGYDGVEIMGSEGYLLTQFLSPRTNHREDDWGGSFANRARLAVEVVRHVRGRVGDGLAIAFRMSMLDLVEGGLTGDELVELATLLEAAGADSLTTGIGWHEARVPTIAQAVPRAAFVSASERIKAAVAIPVAASNRINTPAVAEAILAEGRADFISMARPFLADEAFAAKARNGKSEEINICIACNQACLDHIFTGEFASCLVNPRAGREDEFTVKVTRSAKKVAVAGGGVGGLAAAEMAARIGHNVVLFEASDRLGGQFNLAQHVPGKAEFAETIAYFENALIRQGAEIRLQSPATSTELDSFDHVVVATGVTARQPVIDGIDHPKVASYAEILRRQRVAGETVAIIGGGGIGFDVAAFLLDGDDHHHQDPEAFAAYWGIDMAVNSDGGLQAAGLPAVMPRRQITMLQRKQDRFGRTLGLTTGWVHKAILQRNNVQQIAAVDYRHIDDDGIHITVAGAPRLIAADTIIVCAGQEPEDQLSAALKSAGKAYSVVGGARLAGELDAKRAIEEGSRAAMAI